MSNPAPSASEGNSPKLAQKTTREHMQRAQALIQKQKLEIQGDPSTNLCTHRPSSQNVYRLHDQNVEHLHRDTIALSTHTHTPIQRYNRCFFSLCPHTPTQLYNCCTSTQTYTAKRSLQRLNRLSNMTADASMQVSFFQLSNSELGREDHCDIMARSDQLHQIPGSTH